nr:hypothetical protein B0A51_15679 [Rachicladosporium sp. CCFEE 5018]
MFRLSRAFRLRQQYPHYRSPRIPTPSRPASQLLHSKNGDPYRFQTVRFKQPSVFTWKRIATAALYVTAYYGALQVWDHYMEPLLEDLDVEEGVETSAEGSPEDAAGASEYADDENRFIPLTWARALPRTFYKGSDPEWQEFMKVAKDPPRAKKIQAALVQLVHQQMVARPAITMRIGSNTKVGHYWLEMTYPDAPPLEYQRSGLELGEDFIAWSQQKITADEWWRTKRALWPKAAFDGAYATATLVVGIQWRKAKQAMGWEGRDPFSPEERYKHAVEMMQKHTHAKAGKRLGAQTDPTSSSSIAAPPAPSTPDAKLEPAAATTTTSLPYLPPLPLPAKRDLNATSLPIALSAFSQNLSAAWLPAKAEPPRGAIVVSGLVEVRGSTGKIVFDVQSFYDLGKSEFVRVQATPRVVKRHRQGPRGGA